MNAFATEEKQFGGSKEKMERRNGGRKGSNPKEKRFRRHSISGGRCSVLDLTPKLEKVARKKEKRTPAKSES